MVSTQESESCNPSSNLGGTSMCNDRELACFERVETCLKPPKTCVFCTAEFAFIKPRY